MNNTLNYKPLEKPKNRTLKTDADVNIHIIKIYNAHYKRKNLNNVLKKRMGYFWKGKEFTLNLVSRLNSLF